MAVVVQANLSKLEDIERLFDAVVSEFGGLDIFISNAASGFNRPACNKSRRLGLYAERERGRFACGSASGAIDAKPRWRAMVAIGPGSAGCCRICGGRRQQARAGC